MTRRSWGLPVAVVIAWPVAASIVWMTGCLPDLVYAPAAHDASSDVGAAKAGCGDGIVESDAGEECDPGAQGAIGCTASCTIDCTGGVVDPATGHCYLSAGPARSLEVARTACDHRAAHVVTFVGEEERSMVLGQIAGGAFWVGLYFDSSLQAYRSEGPFEPGYLRACAGCFAHGPPGSFPPARPPGSPSAPCVADDRGASWTLTPCDVGRDAPLDVICEREPPGTARAACDAGSCIAGRAAPKRYVLVGSPATAVEAVRGCGALGGRRAVFQTREEREQVMREVVGALRGSSADGVWIGLSRAAGGWTWDDDASADQRPNEWGDKEPKAAAAGTHAYAAVTDDFDVQLARADDAAKSRPYLCEL